MKSFVFPRPASSSIFRHTYVIIEAAQQSLNLKLLFVYFIGGVEYIGTDESSVIIFQVCNDPINKALVQC